VTERVPVDLASRLETEVSRFEDLSLPRALLINGSFSFPFCPPAEFPRFWNGLLEALPVGGRISGQLFGDHDEWAMNEEMTFHSRADAESLLATLDIEMFDEIERDGSTASGDPKHWHIFSIVARKRERS
jgi:tellurite methyltransferase